LAQHKILITNLVYHQIFEPYINPANPVFITSDTVINAFYVLYNESVTRFEEANAHKLLDVLKLIWSRIASEKEQPAGKSQNKKLSKAHQRDIKNTYAEGNRMGLRQAAIERAQIVIAVAIKLLGDTSIELDASLKGMVEKEVGRVVRAEGLWMPKWLGDPTHGFAALDYSRYKPHGLYTRSEILERYFRALSWLQSIPFRVDNDKELLAILLLGKTFSNPYLDDDAKDLEIEKCFRCYSEIVGQRGDWDLLLASQIIRGRPTDLNTVREFLLKPDLKPSTIRFYYSRNLSLRFLQPNSTSFPLIAFLMPFYFKGRPPCRTLSVTGQLAWRFAPFSAQNLPLNSLQPAFPANTEISLSRKSMHQTRFLRQIVFTTNTYIVWQRLSMSLNQMHPFL
jgi:hypothetical protein